MLYVNTSNLYNWVLAGLSGLNRDFLLRYSIFWMKTPFMLLGEHVQRDREKIGLSQEELAERLNSMGDPPIDPYTKKRKKAYRSWIAKVESGTLQRDLRIDVREWLANALNAEPNIYRILRLRADEVKQDGDLLKEQEEFFKAALTKFEPGSRIHIDSPASGPPANQLPHLLLLVVGIITKHDSKLIIFSNEFAADRKNSTNTLQLVMLLYAIVGTLAKEVPNPDNDKFRTYFGELEWEETLESTTRKIFESVREGRHHEEVNLPKSVVSWMENHLIVHIRNQSLKATERYNPLTLILAESASISIQSAFALDEHNPPWVLNNSSAVAKAFDDRRILFKPFLPSSEEITERAKLYGIELNLQE